MYHSYKSKPVIQLILIVIPVSFKLSFELDSTQSRAHLESCRLAHPYLYPYCIHHIGAISPVPRCFFAAAPPFVFVHSSVHILGHIDAHREDSLSSVTSHSSHRGKWCKCESNSFPVILTLLDPSCILHVLP